MKPTTALVLETNNLQGGQATSQRVVDSLSRLLRHLREQSRTSSELTELVVTHEGFSDSERASLEDAARRSIRFERLPKGTGYYDAKNLGFDATTAEVVAFGDGDCWPHAEWLERLLFPFDASDDVRVVAGRTTYRDDLLGAAATAIDFMYFHGPSGPDRTKNFYANNVAFRRDVFATYRYRPIDGVYRGHCQMLGMRLWEGGVPILFEPRARTTHRFPDSLQELIQLRLLRGQDTAELTPHFAQTYLPSPLRPVGRAPFAALATLGIRWGYSLRAIGRQDMPYLGPLDHLACVAAMSALSVIDAAGAAHRTLRRGSGRSVADAQSLSYHQDVDRLSAERAHPAHQGEHP